MLCMIRAAEGVGPYEGRRLEPKVRATVRIGRKTDDA